ncbi:MAG TPA: galactose oxidase-like domain-containing protein [Candidatus Solibacter sp.]|nr:galactose oxidase-like domain-containing protein [Candidatus Solibacter sp.]
MNSATPAASGISSCSTFAKHALMTTLVLMVSIAAQGQVSVQGQWKTLPTQTPINPVHIALMHTGKVLIVSGSGNVKGNNNFEAAVWDPQTDTIATQTLPWDMFCNGMVVLSDGRPFVLGGTLQYDPFHGQKLTSAFDPTTGTFTNQQSMAHGRWYPTGTTLGDGSVMVFSGQDENGVTNKTVEIFKIGSGWGAASTAPFTPPLYPRMHLLPNGTVFNSGSQTASNIFNPSTHTWTLDVATTNFGSTRTYGTSVLLPLSPGDLYKPRVVIMGGANPATPTTETIDLSLSNPKWVTGPSMSQPRIQMNATILPSGKVLATGGSAMDENGTTASLNADLFDPATETFSSAGANAFPRLYHSNALLLPDATVLLIGGNPARGTFEPHLEIYSPAYLFNSSGALATRPTITSVPTGVISHGSTFQVKTPDTSIKSVVVLRAGAVTHAFNMEQRMVNLSFTAGTGVLNVTAPPNGNIVPPGYYLLFILNSAGVPSVAKFVQF